MARTALITGITGQDGAYLAQHLLEQGYVVYGAHRRSASLNAWRLDELGIRDSIRYVDLELLEFSNILRALDRVQPDEVYNLAAQSHVAVSFEQPLYTADVDALGVTRLLEAIRATGRATRFYQASTSEMYGMVREPIQSETTPFYPRSPYGVAKLYAHWMTVNYREAHGLHATSGILFNHESPLRGREFVTRKITCALAQMARDPAAPPVVVGNVDARRDWGFAGDYVRGMHAMVAAERAADYVLATGETHSVREFAEIAARAAGFDLSWQGEGVDAVAEDAKTGRVIVRVDAQFFRPAEVDVLIGDARRARETLGWQPSQGFTALVEAMMVADLRRAARGVIEN